MTYKPKSLLTIVSSALATVLIGAATASPAIAADRTSVRATMQIPASIQANKLEAPATTSFYGPLVARNKMDSGLVGARGEEQVIVRLNLPSVAQQGYKSDIEAQQDAAIARIAAIAPGMRVLAKTQLVLNAVFLEIDAAYLEQVAADPAVERIAPVANYERQLAETVPYIGAATAQAAGVDGSGVTVAVLDSGIDYTHANLGGGGTLADYEAAWGVAIGDPAQTSRDGLFPTADVVEGYDFVGELWPTFGPLQPDDDPIDFGGHGTHVADIIGGNGGVAPGVDLIAVKVCSAVATSCSGIALIQGMEYAVDPDGDGDTSDHVDIINMSLGSDYGQSFDDDLSLAVENATRIGVLTVSSAGNCGDRPFCTGSPASAPTALSVAQTEVPSATAYAMNVVEPAGQAGLYQAVKYSWTPSPAALIEGVVQYADGAGGNLDGCVAFDAGSLDGLIVAVDRGACNFSQKLQNIEAAGGVLGIVMLVAPGAPFAGAFGGGAAVGIPGFNINQADGNILRAGGALVQFGPQFSAPLVGYTVSSSGRGPDMSYNAIKPEIGAPGASVSAEVGTGAGETAFGGTSGASPMVAGAAALVLSDCDDSRKKSHGWGWGSWFNHNSKKAKCSPLAIKSRLVNTGYRDIQSDTTGGLAEISRIGGGEVRADKALDAPFWAYSTGDDQPVLSLGQIDASRDTSIYRFIKIENLSNRTQKIRVKPTFRFADDEATGAIDISTRDRVTVGKNGQAYLLVKFRIDADALPANNMNSGAQGADPASLGLNEFDGYIVMTSQDGEIAIPWHVMTRKAANVRSARSDIVSAYPDSIGVTNYGAGIAQNDTYSIIGVSDEMPRGDEGAQSPTPDIRSVGVNTYPVPAGFCSANDSFLWVFAVNTWDRQSHLMPVSHQIYLDTNQDGVDDYIILNRDASFNNITDGRQFAWSYNLATGDAEAFFYAEHATSTGNTALIVCAEQVGLTGTDMLATNVNVSVFAQDFYYGGPGDSIGDITVTPLGEQYYGVTSDLAAGESGVLDVYDFGLWPGNTPEHGVMMFTNGDRGAGAHGGATEKTEALLYMAPGAVAPEKLPRKGKHRWHWD